MKKMINKFIMVIATVIMIFNISICFGSVNAAETITDNPTFYVEGGETCAGYNIYVPITMETVKGISAADIKVLYYSGLEFVKFEKAENGVQNVTASVNKDEGEVVVTFANDNDVTGIVPIGNLILKVPENAETGMTYEVFVKEVSKIVSKQEGELVGYYAGETTIEVIDTNELLENGNMLAGNNKKIIILASVVGIVVAIIFVGTVVFIVKRKKK